MTATDELDAFYLRACYMLAEDASDDPATRNAAYLVNPDGRVIGAAANEIPVGVEHTAERLARPPGLKYVFMEHAERGAIFQAARTGEATENATLYCPWFACHDCARAIIAAGITRVVGHKQMFDHAGAHGSWPESIRHGDTMLAEAGVITCRYDGRLDQKHLFNGEYWNA